MSFTFSTPNTKQQMQLFSFLIKASSILGKTREKLLEAFPNENFDELDEVVKDAKCILTSIASPNYFKSRSIEKVLKQTNRNSMTIADYASPKTTALPNEIIFKCFNILFISEDRDRKSLAPIRLVSRSWYHAATAILHSTLQLTFEKDIFKLSKLLSGLALQKTVWTLYLLLLLQQFLLTC